MHRIKENIDSRNVKFYVLLHYFLHSCMRKMLVALSIICILFLFELIF